MLIHQNGAIIIQGGVCVITPDQHHHLVMTARGPHLQAVAQQGCRLSHCPQLSNTLHTPTLCPEKLRPKAAFATLAELGCSSPSGTAAGPAAAQTLTAGALQVQHVMESDVCGKQ